jgi:hypothetical protein
MGAAGTRAGIPGRNGTMLLAVMTLSRKPSVLALNSRDVSPGLTALVRDT